MRGRTSSSLVAALALFVTLVAGDRTSLAGADGDISIGTAVTIDSEVLGEQRTVLVHVPSGYGLTTDRFPVLYLLDGKANFDHVATMVRHLGDTGAIPRMIVVAIANTDRNRDFTPSHLERDAFGYDVSTSGGAAKFQTFLARELIPFVDKSYRTQPYRLLGGSCLTGMFAVHTLLTRGDLFDAYLASGPYLSWDSRAILGDIDAALATSMGKRSRPRFLFASYSLDGITKRYSIDSDVATLEQALRRSAPAGLTWKVAVLEGEDHDTSTHASLYLGLRTLYRDFKPADDLDLAGLEQHYRKLSQRYGYGIAVPELTVNLLGYKELGQKNTKAAIAIFERNAALHPDSANVYDSLGEGYEAVGKLARALASYRKAIALLERTPTPDPRVLAIYQEHVTRVEKALAAGKSAKPAASDRAKAKAKARRK